MSDIKMGVGTSIKILGRHTKLLLQNMTQEEAKSSIGQIGLSLIEIEFILKSLHEMLHMCTGVKIIH